MSALDLYTDLRRFLRLTSRVVSKHGEFINVDEKFTLRFTVTNAAYSPNTSRPAIVFRNVKVSVAGTSNAVPVAGPGTHNFPQQTLHPGESSHVDIEFRAINDLPGDAQSGIDRNHEEMVARADAKADLDQNLFFSIRKHLNSFEEIVET